MIKITGDFDMYHWYRLIIKQTLLPLKLYQAMKLYLSPETRIKEIKKSFQEYFPYLKLEFFREKHKPEEGNSKKDIIVDSATLIDVTGVMKEGEVNITSDETVEDLEQLFQNKFNLPVQVFRKTRYSWIETTKTDNLTLGKQNRMGKDACGARFDFPILL